MSNSSLLQECLLALSRFFIGDAPMDVTLRKVVELAQEAVPSAAMVGITMMVDSKPATAVFSNTKMVDIDRGQYDVGDGPCLSAFRKNEVVLIDNISTDDRWPLFVEKALEHEIGSTMSLPMGISGKAIGALNFYALDTSAFDDDSIKDGTVFAEQAAIVLANSQAYWLLRDLNQNLQEALESRSVIEQAKGILMARSKVDAARAFDLLVIASQKSNRKLREIATELVNGVSTQP